MPIALVTGGAGFIGSNLAEALLKNGYEVRVIDDFSSGKKQNLKELPVDIIRGDIINRSVIEKAMKGCDVVFHQAALVSVPLSIDDPIKANEINVKGSLNVLLAARDMGVNNIVYASSCAIYGDAKVPITEKTPIAPLSPYAVTKLLPEYYGHE